MTARLGAGWRPAADGRLERDAARLVVFDDAGRVLLLRGHTLERPDESWWFTIGGGIEAGEAPAQAAARELFEETGLRVDASDLVGPVWRRMAEFRFLGTPVRQYEEFFVATLTSCAAFDRTGWTDVEREFMDEVRWWDPADLAASRETVYPEGFAGLAADLARGWDGTLRDLEPEHDADV